MNGNLQRETKNDIYLFLTEKFWVKFNDLDILQLLHYQQSY